MTRPSWGRGQAGQTHCGAWIPVRPGETYGWITRLVCVLSPGHDGEHESRRGWTWQKEETDAH